MSYSLNNAEVEAIIANDHGGDWEMTLSIWEGYHINFEKANYLADIHNNCSVGNILLR